MNNAPPGSTLRCKCGGESRVRGINDERSPVDVAMNTRSRVRVCCVCGDPWKTVELDASELASLRRKAYLYELMEIKRWKALQAAEYRATRKLKLSNSATSDALVKQSSGSVSDTSATR